jgi:hypothetical protein
LIQVKFDPSQFLNVNFSDGYPDLTCVKRLVGKLIHLSPNDEEHIMPIESALVTVFVLIVFTGFALVLAWAERQTRGLKTSDSHKE